MNDLRGQHTLTLALGAVGGLVAFQWGPWLAVAVLGIVAAPVLFLIGRADAGRSAAPRG